MARGENHAAVEACFRRGLTLKQTAEELHLTRGQVSGVSRVIRVRPGGKCCRPVGFIPKIDKVDPQAPPVVREWQHAAERLAQSDPVIRRSLERFPCEAACD